MNRFAALGTLLLVGFLGFATCLPDQDAGDIAKAMAERLSDALDFEGGHPEDGPPPEDHAGDPAYPQITSLDAPSELDLGELFTLRLTTDFVDTARIAGAIVHVDLAEGHIVIDAPYSDVDGWLELSGRLREDPRIQGRPFLVHVGLRDVDGAVGNYVEWRLNVAPEPEEADAEADAEVEPEPPVSQPGAPCNATDSPCEGELAPSCVDIDGEQMCSFGCTARADCTAEFPGGCCLELADQSTMCAPAEKCGRDYLDICTTPYAGICNAGLVCINDYDGTGYCWYLCDTADRWSCPDGGVCYEEAPVPPICIAPGPIAYNQTCGQGFGECAADLWCDKVGADPTGTCRWVCTFPDDLGTCPDGGTCTQIQDDLGYCMSL